jgi:REP element-mobilizing transposase RayT
MADLWHVTWVTHNSRTSPRMVRYHVQKGKPVVFDDATECAITDIIGQIIRKYNIRIWAYNICRDHIHMLLETPYDQLGNTVKTMKSVSSLEYKRFLGIEPSEPFHLWAQKFNKWRIDSDDQRYHAARYILFNRKKHRYPENKGLKPLVLSLLVPEAAGSYAAEIDKTVSKEELDAIINNGIQYHMANNEQC